MFKAIIACAILLFMPTASAEIKSYEASEEYVMSEFETIDIAKQRAKQKALRAAQELAGVYVQSNTHVVNLMVSNDEIFTLTAGILNLTSVKFSFKELDDLTFIVKATVKADIDSDDLDKYLNRTPAERAALVAQNLELQKAIAAQDAQIAELKRQLATTPLDKVSLSEQFAAENKVFLSNQQLSEAGKLYYNGDFNAAITHCSQAIALYPKNFSAFSIRGAIDRGFFLWYCKATILERRVAYGGSLRRKSQVFSSGASDKIRRRHQVQSYYCRVKYKSNLAYCQHGLRFCSNSLLCNNRHGWSINLCRRTRYYSTILGGKTLWQ